MERETDIQTDADRYRHRRKERQRVYRSREIQTDKKRCVLYAMRLCICSMVVKCRIHGSSVVWDN